LKQIKVDEKNSEAESSKAQRADKPWFPHIFFDPAMDTLYLTNYDTRNTITDFAIKCLAQVELLAELRYLALDLEDCESLLKMEYLSNFPKLRDIFVITTYPINENDYERPMYDIKLEKTNRQLDKVALREALEEVEKCKTIRKELKAKFPDARIPRVRHRNVFRRDHHATDADRREAAKEFHLVEWWGLPYDPPY
jgi:hypothetical protein